MIELHGFTISHYVEKARWALDYKGVPYEWRVVLVGPHRRQVPKMAPKTTVPVLRDGETVVQGSSEILDWAEERFPDRPLTPASEAEGAETLELEARFDDVVGQATRRIFYGYNLPHRKAPVFFFKQGGPAWAGAFYAVAYPLLARIIGGFYETTPENVRRDEARLAEMFDELDARVAGRSYLVGDTFTRADLTLCALLSILWQPPEHPATWPSADVYPEGYLSWLAEHTDRPLRDYVLRVYREHRRPVAAAA